MLQLGYNKIANWENVCLVTDLVDPSKKVENPFNFTMGLFLMHTGTTRITRKGASEFYLRAKLVEACYGALFTNGDGTPRYLTTDDVIAYIGLSSNVSSWSQPQFFTHLRKDVISNLTRTMDYALQKHEQEADAAPVGK
jgi:hypothetical protein